jgi:hypothetical protein
MRQDRHEEMSRYYYNNVILATNTDDKIELFIRFTLGQNSDHGNHTGCRINFLYDPPIADTITKPSLQMAGQLFDISGV